MTEKHCFHANTALQMPARHACDKCIRVHLLCPASMPHQLEGFVTGIRKQDSLLRRGSRESRRSAAFRREPLRFSGDLVKSGVRSVERSSNSVLVRQACLKVRRITTSPRLFPTTCSMQQCVACPTEMNLRYVSSH